MNCLLKEQKTKNTTVLFQKKKSASKVGIIILEQTDFYFKMEHAKQGIVLVIFRNRLIPE